MDDVGSAHPHITKAVETMVKKGKWTVPGALPSCYLSTLEMYLNGIDRLQGEVWRSLPHVDSVTCTTIIIETYSPTKDPGHGASCQFICFQFKSRRM